MRTITNNFPTFGFLFRKSAAEYYRVINGVVQLLPGPAYLGSENAFWLDDPDGWNELGIRWERDKNYGGIFQTYSQSLKFRGEAAQIINYLYGQFGVSAELEVLVLKCNFNIDATPGETLVYNEYFAANIDFTTISLAFDAITCALRDTGAVSLLKANDGIDYTIEMEGNPDAIRAYIDGVTLKNSTIWTISDNPAGDNVNVFNKPQMNIASSETQYIDDATIQDYSESLDTNHFFVSSTEQDVVLDYDFSVQAYPLSGVNYSTSELVTGFYKLLADGVTTVHYWLVYEPSYLIFLYYNYVLKGSVTIPMLPGEKLYYFSSIFNAQIEWKYNTDPNLVAGTIKIGYDTTITATEPYGLRIFDALKQTLAKASNGKIGLISDYLSDPDLIDVDAYPYWDSYFCGDALREIPNAKMSLNVADIIKDLRSRYCLRATMQGNSLRVEKMGFFYDEDNEIFDLGEVSDLELKCSQDDIYNQIQIGYKDQTFDTLNGRDEYNTMHQYEIEFDGKVKGQLDLLSPYNASMYAITVASYNREGKPTTDSKADSEIFILNLNPILELINDEYVRRAFRPNNYYYSIDPDRVQNVLSPLTDFNMPASPTRNLIRSARFLAIGTDRMQNGQKIKFTSSTKNDALISNIGYGEIVESQSFDLPIARPYYLPDVIDFRCPVGDNFANSVMQYPHGYISATWYGLPVKGYLNKGGQADAENGVFDFQLQLHTDTDKGKIQKY